MFGTRAGPLAMRRAAVGRHSDVTRGPYPRHLEAAMPDVTVPEPNTFCWADLQTTDPTAARTFYSKLFDWTITDMPGAMPYGLASLPGNKMAAGIMELPAQARAMGAPSHWLSYIAVDDVEVRRHPRPDWRRLRHLARRPIHGHDGRRRARLGWLERAQHD
jgi:hypothetical protein